MILQPVSFGAQWAWTGGDSADSPNMGGVAALRFPGGAKVWRIDWNSSVKVPMPQGEALFWLMAHSNPRFDWSRYMAALVLATHHANGAASLTRGIPLPAPLVWAPGIYVWVAASGAGEPHAAPLEVQVTLWCEAPVTFEGNPLVPAGRLPMGKAPKARR